MLEIHCNSCLNNCIMYREVCNNGNKVLFSFVTVTHLLFYGHMWKLTNIELIETS